RRLDVEALYTELRRTLRHGARASRLVRFTPELVELLLPSEANPDATIYERAIQAEGIVREALERIGGPEAEALSILLCLKPGTTGMTLEARRQRAGAVLGIQPGTMRRERHEGLLVWDLGMEVYGIVTGGDHQVS
ncbi:MAG: hypothetical protein J2P37_29855, partial [Ktedonobacteraceae bacterium]|nr:hypothetical protein [Ktedonobacteraceae bacterium]